MELKRHSLPGVILALFMIALLALPVLANAGPSTRSPSPGGLIPTTTDAIRIMNENLTVRMVDENGNPPPYYYGFAQVTAEYTLQNTTDKSVSLSLMYLSPNTKEFNAMLNNEPLVTKVGSIDPKDLPADWKVPNQVLDPLDGEYELRADIGYGSLTPYTFDITVGAKQEATLHMEATQLLGFDAARHMNVIRHFAYLLAPAKNWAGFGTLNITVVVANNQIFTSNPPLTEQSRDAHTITYTGSFNGIPADALRVATISNQNLWLGSSAIVTIIPNAIVGFLAGLIGFALGHLFVRNRRAIGWEATLSGCLGIFISAILGFISALIVSYIASRIFDYPEFAGSYGFGFEILFGILLGVFLAIIVSFFGGVIYLIMNSRRHA